MNPFKTALTRTPNYSAYSVTHHNTLTYPIGRLMPIYWEFLNPADRLVLDLSHLTRFNTLAGALMGTDLKLDVDAFAVPVRTLRHYPQDAYDDMFFNFRKNVDGAIKLPMMNHHAAYSRALQLSVNSGVPFECSLFDTLGYGSLTGYRTNIQAWAGKTYRYDAGERACTYTIVGDTSRTPQTGTLKLVADCDMYDFPTWTCNLYDSNRKIIFSGSIEELFAKYENTEVNGRQQSIRYLVIKAYEAFLHPSTAANYLSTTEAYNYLNDNQQSFYWRTASGLVSAQIYPYYLDSTGQAFWESMIQSYNFPSYLCAKYLGMTALTGAYAYSEIINSDVNKFFETVVLNATASRGGNIRYDADRLKHVSVAELCSYLGLNLQSEIDSWLSWLASFDSKIGVRYDNTQSADFLMEDAYIRPLGADIDWDLLENCEDPDDKKYIEMQQRANALIAKDLQFWFYRFGAVNEELNDLPVRSYWRIYNDWYRNLQLANMTNDEAFENYLEDGIDDNPSNHDWIPAMRCWAGDYFTTAFTAPSAGAAVLIPTSGTMSDLRASSAFQRFKDKVQYAGMKVVDQWRAFFGAVASSRRAEMSEVLNRLSFDVKMQPITQTSAPTAENDSPLGTLGANALSYGGAHFIDFTSEEPTVIMVIASIRPNTVYSQGISPMLTKGKSLFDFPIPEFTTVGEQSIQNSEIYFDYNQPRIVASGEFGYTRRYGEWMKHDSEVHGKFNTTLKYLTAHRIFDETPQLSEEFLKVDVARDSLNRIFAVDTYDNVASDFYFSGKVVRALPKYINYSL